MQYVVLDNGKACDHKHHKVHSSWNNASFGSFPEALAYAKKWLGSWDSLSDDWDGKPYDYTGYGDTIEIKELKYNV